MNRKGILTCINCKAPLFKGSDFLSEAEDGKLIFSRTKEDVSVDDGSVYCDNCNCLIGTQEEGKFYIDPEKIEIKEEDSEKPIKKNTGDKSGSRFRLGKGGTIGLVIFLILIIGAIIAFAVSQGQLVDFKNMIGDRSRETVETGDVEKTDETENVEETTVSPDLSSERITETLRLGSEGREVEILQAKLKKLGLYEGQLNGAFTSSVEEAVKAFQKANGLNPDGVVGPKTRGLLNGDPEPTPAPVVSGGTTIIKEVVTKVDEEALKELQKTIDDLSKEIKDLKETSPEPTTPPTVTIYKPSATSLVAENIEADCAEFKGKVNPKGGATEAWFQYGTNSSSLNKKSDVIDIGNGTIEQEVSIIVGELSPGTRYWYKMYAKNSKGESYGLLKYFTTAATATPSPTSTPEKGTLSVTKTREISESGMSFLDIYLVVENSSLAPKEYTVKINGVQQQWNHWIGSNSDINVFRMDRPVAQKEIVALVKFSDGTILESKIVKYPQ
jgi:peptidoglycan hydrolase-like protein with peptidoglycan-binding domain